MACEQRMNTSVVLRVHVGPLDLDVCLARLSSEPDKVWRVGEKGLRGKLHQTSGFSVHLADGMARESVVQDAVVAFRELAEPIAQIVQGGGTAEADFGLFVSGWQPVSLCFEPAATALFERAGVTLRVSAYPCSDDEDDDEEPKAD